MKKLVSTDNNLYSLLNKKAFRISLRGLSLVAGVGEISNIGLLQNNVKDISCIVSAKFGFRKQVIYKTGKGTL